MVKDDTVRMDATKCLSHPWLEIGKANTPEAVNPELDALKQLEAASMRKVLARRRWTRWLNIIKAMNRLQGSCSFHISNKKEASVPLIEAESEADLDKLPLSPC